MRKGSMELSAAREDVTRAGGRERHNHAHWPRWVGLRPCDARNDRQRGSARYKMQKISTGKFHLNLPLASHHSNTSSARPRSGSGTVRPNALAVLKLMYSSTLLACWTGRLAGLSPLRIRPV